MKEAKIPVAKEGYPFIVFSFFVTVVLAILELKAPALISLVVSGLVLNFFRDPERVIPAAEKSIVSPADGKIIKVETLNSSKFTNEPVQKISIFMNIFNVHVNRAPFAGQVTDIQFSPGKFYSADSNRASLENEYCAVTTDIGDGKSIIFVQIAGLIARRILCWAELGDNLSKGQRFGLIRFGSRVDVYLPTDTKINVSVGQKVIAGETVIAHLS